MAEIYLRPLRLEDAKISYEWRNNPRVWAYTGSRPTCDVTVEMEVAWMKKVLGDGNSRRFAICLKETGGYIGNVYLTNIDWEKKSGEEGIFIGDVSMWGCGIGTQARLEMQKLVSREYGIKEVTSRIRIDNIASLKSALKAGFVELGRDSEWVSLTKKLDFS